MSVWVILRLFDNHIYVIKLGLQFPTHDVDKKYIIPIDIQKTVYKNSVFFLNACKMKNDSLSPHKYVMLLIVKVSLLQYYCW